LLRGCFDHLKKHVSRFSSQIQSPNRALGTRRRVALGVELLESRLTPAQLSVSPAALPIDTAGQNYSVAFQATGGDGHYSFALASSTLPQGLSLSSTGVLSGRTTLAGSFTLTVNVTDTTERGLSGSERCTLTVNPGAASTFAVTSQATATAGVSFLVAITAKDAYGNLATGFSGNLTLISSDGQTVHLATVNAFNRGLASDLVTLDTADRLTLSASSGTIRGTTGTITVSPAAVAGFAISEPTTVTAGVRFNVTITAKDAFGNTLTGFSGNVVLTSSDGQTVNLAAMPAFSNGSAIPTVTLDKADTLTLTVTLGTIRSTGGSITVNPGAAAGFGISEPTTATAGVSFNVSIKAMDAYGNTVNGFSGTVTLTSSDGQTVYLAATPVFSHGTANAVVTLDKADSVTLTATSGTIKGTGGSTTVSAGSSDWFSQNMPDPALQALARSDFNRDSSLTYNDALGLFAEAEGVGALTTAELQSLQALVTTSGAAAVNLASSVQNLTYKVVDGDPANAQFQGATLGNLHVGSSATQLQELVAKWFLGEDLPTIDTQYTQSWGSCSYALASGTLFGSGGPSYKDVAQGEEGDCWLLASFGVTAANDPSIIQSMFTDDGTTMENGVQVHVWTVRFYENGAASYLTVNNYLPQVNGMFAYANLGQMLSNPNNVLWVPLAEKAYAELCASGWNQRPQANAYVSLNGGTATTALPTITAGAENYPTNITQSSFTSALAAGTLFTLASSPSGNSSLGIVGDHDYAVLGYNATTQTFTLLNPWGWNNTSGYPGILTLTWAQLAANFSLDGDCTP